MSLALSPPMRRRRLSLTPLIDVVFLLLVFFMLAARFGAEGTISLGTAGDAAAYEGPPRLIVISSGGVTLNGRPLPVDALGLSLERLTNTPDDPILLQAATDVALQQLTDLISSLNQAGFDNLVLIE